MTGTSTLPGSGALPAAAPLPPADGAAAEHLLVCKQVHRVTHDMTTFSFEPAEPRLFRHDPGQYLVFSFEIDGRRTDRCYTLSSPPSRPHLAAITVKRVPGGRVSTWLHEHLAPGDVVRARGPFGRFSPARHPAPAYLFLSGGSGITPLMCMTRTLHDLASPADVVFVHSARTPDDIPFRQELELLAATAERLRVVHVCESDGATERWRGHRGRLTPDTLHRIAPDFLHREVFTCGPPGYMRAVRDMLSAAGLPRGRYHEESFEAVPPAGTQPAPADGPSTASTQPTQARAPVPAHTGAPARTPPTTGVPTAATGADDDEATGFVVELSRSGRRITCAAGTSVLEAAARAGITLPSSCGEGACGTCVTTLQQGSVDMHHQGGLGPREEARNQILLCCSTPRENLVIDA